MSIYVAMYKPYEVLSQFSDSYGRKTLKDFIPVPGIYAAGRLDYRSEGLLLLTDDGTLIHRITDPRFNHTKTYFAQVEGIVTQQALLQLNRKIILPDLQNKIIRIDIISEPTLQPRSKPVRDYHPTSWLKIIICEGKKHIVRRLTAAIGFPTLRLIRVAIGNLNLGNLRPGEWRYLSFSEVNQLTYQPATIE